jgi:hypothetical protein
MQSVYKIYGIKFDACSRHKTMKGFIVNVFYPTPIRVMSTIFFLAVQYNFEICVNMGPCTLLVGRFILERKCLVLGRWETRHGNAGVSQIHCHTGGQRRYEHRCFC